MSEVFNRVLAGIEDLLSTSGTATVNQTRDGPLLAQTKAITPVNTSSLLSSTATRALHASLAAATTIHACFSAVISGGAIQYASAAQNGQIYRMTAAPAVADQPTAYEINDARTAYWPSSAQKSALGASFSAASSTNYYPTLADLTSQYSVYDPELGDGSDGVATIGAITGGTPAAPATALSGSVGTGNITGDRYYKVSVGNLSGTVTASSNSTLLSPSSQNVTVTLPSTGYTNAQWVFIYACATAGGTYYEIGRVNYGTTTFTDRLTTLPGSGNTAPGSDTSGASSATMSGAYNFIGGNSLAGFTINVASTGQYAGKLTLRFRGVGASAFRPGTLTITGTGKYAAGDYNTKDICHATTLYGAVMSAPGSTPASAISTTSTGTGLGAVFQQRHYAGFGGKGTLVSGTAGPGGYAGGDVQIYCEDVYGSLLTGTYNILGEAGTAGSAGTSASGGGGGAGGRFLISCRRPAAGTATINVSGGVGGAGFGSGGALTASGGGGGGGGFIVFIGPNWITSSMTLTVAGGLGGAKVATASGNCQGGAGGGAAGNGGAGGNNDVGVAGSAGQTINISTYNAGKRHGVAA